MDSIFMNSENSRTSECHVLVLRITDKLDLRRGQKSIALSNRSIYYTWKNIKSSYNSEKFKISAPTWSDEFELWMMDHIHYQIFKIIKSIFLKSIMKILIIHQSEYMYKIKLKIELHLKLKLDIILRF